VNGTVLQHAATVLLKEFIGENGRMMVKKTWKAKGQQGRALMSDERRLTKEKAKRRDGEGGERPPRTWVLGRGGAVKHANHML